ncbi:MAG: hypothetical protein M1819_001876 [Sarea resinae]|nr:MAG: hypothetical protein M1819_001876 [Sarea resinae]
MAPSRAITETIILHLEEGVNLADAASGSAAVQTFAQLTNTIKAQQGYICQFWVVDLSHLLSDWQSSEHHAAFIKSKAYKSFIAGVGQVFALEVAAPLKIYTRFPSASGATAALKAPVTEIAFLTLPDGAGEDVRATIDRKLRPIDENVTTVGKGLAAATGWVFEVQNHAEAVNGATIALHGLFGYNSIEDHMRWRETPEHAQAIETMEDVSKNQGLEDANVTGRDMFHVHFHAGI